MNEPRHLLWLVEDDPELCSLATQYLSSHDYEVRAFTNGRSLFDELQRGQPDLLILDVMLPGIDGFEICRRVRAQWSGPIVILSARTETVDEVVGLEVGADDYLKKPIAPRLLLARVQAHLRRVGRADPPEQPFSVGPLLVDPRRRDGFVNGQAAGLSTAEFDLLWLLCTEAGRVVSREQLHRTLRGIEYDGADRSIDVRVTRVRRKLGEAGRLLMSVRGTGYQLAVLP